MTFKRPLAITLLCLGLAEPAFASPGFTCSAKGDAWSVTGGPARAADCSVTCLLSDPQGDHDRVVCATRLSGSSSNETICEGEQRGRHWTGAELLLSQCSYDQR